MHALRDQIMGTIYAWQIRPVSSVHPHGYGWQWSREDLKGSTERVSEKCFEYYYDCVLDAKQHGFNPEAPRRLR